MSGGYFDYDQYRIGNIKDSIAQLVLKKEKGTLPEYYDFSEETFREFKNALYVLARAEIYAQRIDWLLSADDGEESFHSRLLKELEELDDETIFKNVSEED